MYYENKTVQLNTLRKYYKYVNFHIPEQFMLIIVIIECNVASG